MRKRFSVKIICIISALVFCFSGITALAESYITVPDADRDGARNVK